MPRSARIDIEGLLQHVIARGIEKRDIFCDDKDRRAFVERLSPMLLKTRTQCLAWALMSNHFHLLLRPTEGKLSELMRRLLTGYAVSFNLRHHRSGHLCQRQSKIDPLYWVIGNRKLTHLPVNCRSALMVSAAPEFLLDASP